jgi:hypothetical protein
LLIVTVFGKAEEITQNFGLRAMKKECDIVGRVHSNITAMCWKDNRGRYINSSATEDNFWSESWNALKPQVLQTATHMTGWAMGLT